MYNQRTNNLGIKEFLKLADIAKGRLSKIRGDNYNLVEEMFHTRAKDILKDAGERKQFLFNFYARLKFSERLRAKYNQ